MPVSEYEANFLRLSGYAQGMIATKKDKCVRRRRYNRAGNARQRPLGQGANQTEVRQLAFVYAARHIEDCDVVDVIGEVPGEIFPNDLMELLFNEFDLILGMDC
ncbi:hypothetical protein EPI10_001629 [Gossypium australe]|uniref:Uncharacterized protein n=1 Tax=Gossypium australe TaxID=47621 RepID=A0A5B6VBW7_9ROSI|nr:hypothetical protein EPI10_001629 [Gossypium australe]